MVDVASGMSITGIPKPKRNMEDKVFVFGDEKSRFPETLTLLKANKIDKMMGIMGNQQPMDFSRGSDHHTSVLDLRKVKDENQHYNNSSAGPTMTTLPPSPYQVVSPIACYPSTTYFSSHPIQHHESSEDSSERGSLSPPSSVMSSPTFPVTPALMASGIGRAGKPTRPFKAYPKDPMTIPALSSAESLLGHASNEAYVEFRRRMLAQVQAVTTSGSSNSKMKRPVSPKRDGDDQAGQHQQPTSCSDGDSRDAAYWERRRKNNEAAKRSRDARRAKEDEIAIRAAFLEQENVQLKYENATLRNEAAKLRCLLFNR